MDLTAGHLANAIEAMDRAQRLLLEAHVHHDMAVEAVRDHLYTASMPLNTALHRLKVEVKHG